VERAHTQGRLWGAAAHDWCRLVEPFLVPAYQAVFDAVGVRAGTKLLDAGCGAGLALRLAATRGAAVSGIDASTALLRLARRRIPAADLRRGALEELPYPDGSFTVVTAFDSVPYACDPSRAVRELRRVAAPGSAVAVITWAEAEVCQQRRILAAVGAMLPPTGDAGGGPFRLSPAGKLMDLVCAAGLTPQRVGMVPIRFTYPDLSTAVRAQLATASARQAVEHTGAAATEAVLRVVLAHHLEGDGSYRQDDTLRYVIASA
jgi:ubiquinone/menaquinone biosynthesis C-methylase UbiE